MRLLHARTLKSEEFFGANIPPYAILSHRWEDAEVTFQDVESGSGTDKKGWGKIKGCCERAAKDGWDYAVGNQRYPFEAHLICKWILVDRYLLHRQNEQFRASGSDKQHVSLV